jgi:hypothetical protein
MGEPEREAILEALLRARHARDGDGVAAAPEVVGALATSICGSPTLQQRGRESAPAQLAVLGLPSCKL